MSQVAKNLNYYGEGDKFGSLWKFRTWQLWNFGLLVLAWGSNNNITINNESFEILFTQAINYVGCAFFFF